MCCMCTHTHGPLHQAGGGFAPPNPKPLTKAVETEVAAAVSVCGARHINANGVSGTACNSSTDPNTERACVGTAGEGLGTSERHCCGAPEGVAERQRVHYTTKLTGSCCRHKH